MNERAVILGEELFSLTFVDGWDAVREALRASGVSREDVVLIDATGRVCQSFDHLAEAVSAERLPVRAYDVRVPAMNRDLAMGGLPACDE